MVTGIVILLVQANLITLILPLVWPILLILIGLYVVLSSQRQMVEKKMKKKAIKHEEKLEKKLEKEHNKETSKLEKELDNKDAVLEEQETVIDDMVNPKQ